MNIALFTDTYLPDINGVVNSVELTRKKLSDLGHDVYVVCPHPDVLKGVIIENYIIKVPGIELKHLYGYTAASPLYLSTMDELAKLNLDLIHIHSEFGLGIFGTICAKAFDIPIVRTYHTTYEDYTHYVNFINLNAVDNAAKKMVSLISRLYGNDCVRLIAPSKKTKEMLVRYGIKSPIEVIPTGIELKRFKPGRTSETAVKKIRQASGIKGDEKLLLFVGRIAEEKSVDKIIKAFKKVKNDKLNIRFAVVGAGPSLDDLKKLAKDLGVEDYITFFGRKEFDEVPSYYHASDYFISASTTETQGITYVEALASGLPVLANFDEVLNNIVIDGKNGYFFSNEEEIYECIKKVLSLTDEEYASFSRNAIETASGYDDDLFGTKIEKLYLQAIEDYKNSYVISKTNLKGDVVTLRLEKKGRNPEKLTLALDDYFALGFRNDDKITDGVYYKLKEKEDKALAYEKSIKRLALRDYTVRQMRDYLDRYHIDKEEKDEIISKLTELKLLDDKAYAVSKISLYSSSLFSKRRIENKLLQDGVSREIIDECLVIDKNKDMENAISAARKYQNSIRNKTIVLKKQTILKKLMNDGFDYDSSKKAIELLDFSKDFLQESSLLDKEAMVAKRKYEKKYSGSQLRNKVYFALTSKGFSAESVYAKINEMEWTND